MTSTRERALLPAVALQGAVSALGGFIGFFIMAAHEVDAMFRFTAIMQTAAIVATVLACLCGRWLRIDGSRLLRAGFLLPGVLLLGGDGSVATLGIAFGAFIGMTWTARHWLEMSLLKDAERDGYAARSGAWMVLLGVGATLATTLLLAFAGEHSDLVYRLYGALCVLGGCMLGKRLPATAPLSIGQPLTVLRQPEFLACLPLFFLESGLFGIGQSVASAGAVKALGSASQFGWVGTVAGLAGAVALYITRKHRGLDNRMHWLGGACLVMALSFMLLAASVWLPVLYVGYSVLKAAGGPFLSASEQVLNQRTLDVRGGLADRIFARELVLWALRMLSLLMFWGLARTLSPTAVIVAGASLLAMATGLEYLIGRAWFGHRPAPLESAA